MSEFTHQFTALPGDIDELDHVNNAVWVQWVQELATAHWNSAAPQEAIDSYIWVVTRHEIDYRGNISLNETVTGRTWISEPPKGARFWRNFDFTNSNGKIMVSGRTNWAIIERISGRPVRVPQQLTDLFLT